MKTPVMKCGHSANSEHNGKPACVICAGLTPDAEIIDDTPPDLTGRIAVCFWCCGNEKPSSFELPFFEYQGDTKSSNLSIPILQRLEKERQRIIKEQWAEGRSLGTLNPGQPEDEKHFTQHASDRVKEIQTRIRNSRTGDSFYCGCHGWD